MSVSGWMVLIVLMAVSAGCGAVQTRVAPEFNGARVDTVSLHEPENDVWGLTPVVHQELRSMGYRIVAPSSPEADLTVRFMIIETPEINEVNEVVSRPESLHVQFLDPGAQSPVATGDYTLSPLSSRQNPEQGVKEIFAELKGQMGAAESSTSPRPERPAVGLPNNKKPVVEPAAKEAPVTEKKPVRDRDDETEPDADSDHRSPWVPRLESWGFEEWGKPGEGNGQKEMMQ